MTTGKTTRGKKKTGTKGFALLPAKLAAGVAAGAKRKLDELAAPMQGLGGGGGCGGTLTGTAMALNDLFKHVVVDGGADKPMPGADTAAFKNALADRVAHIKALAATRGCRISLKGSSDVGTPS
ncbi:cytochrome b559 subunit alpha [Micractinium conductrix]|uniref:Cytochrome b559 subunit alpha n=1 Tax=Micractinium conductrix TaxID=554055 RepID=A0A2P6V151_9CHLO|nr:cytochrome b559 subunit alpha [Micractinium conductrix]|eukprot:PSC67821.1 cytochrome b559 subunit alpha [Micractinium conductrix]